MAERTVSVKVDLKAQGSLGLTTAQIAKNMGAAFTAAKKLQDTVASQKMLAGMAAAAKSAADPFHALRAAGGKAAPVADMMRKLSANTQAASAMIAGMSAASAAAGLNPVAKEQAKKAAELQAKTLRESLGKLTLGAGAAAAAGTGFVAAASPAAYQTLTGSLKLAAGEIGLLLIPAVVEVSRFFQGLAKTLRAINDATGGLIGQFLKVAAVPTALVLLGAAVFSAVKWVYTMAGAASAASMSLGLLARGGGAHWMAAGMGGAPGAVGSFSRLGAGIGGGVAIGSALLGSAVGGAAGSAISNIGGMAGTGAMIGAGFGPWGAAIGGLSGAIVGAIVTGFQRVSPPAASFNFQNQTSNIEDMHDIIQREALRDPMQQQQAEQQAKAVTELARQIGYLGDRIGANNQTWHVGE